MSRPRLRHRSHARVLATVTIAVAGWGCAEAHPPMTCAPWGDPAGVAARPSPYDSVMLVEDSLVAKLCYSRPSTRGRTIFGGLVPYDTLWRTGANEPTVIHLAEPAEIAGFPVERGEYSIYTVPSRTGWSVVLNAATDQWGLTRDEYGADGNLYPNAYVDRVRRREIGRAPMEIEEIPFTEQLTARFQMDDGRRGNLLIDWETTRLVIPLHFE